MIEEESRKNYLLDYKASGDIGNMKIITINFAVSAGADYDRAIEWMREKLLRNEREFTLGDYGPYKNLIDSADANTQTISEAQEAPVTW